MSILFETTTINGMTLKNRFVRSATWEGMAGKDGACTPALIDMMVQLVNGGVGLIISGHTYVSPEGQASPGQIGIYTDELLPGLIQMVGAVHEADGKIILQLAHAGCRAPKKFAGAAALGPSAPGSQQTSHCREMTGEDIRFIIEAFGQGAVRAREAGFDGVQIHAAHGYLLSQFLSPFYNKRKDEYGGTIKNRARLLLEILGSIRSKTGDDFPVLVKMNSEDFLEGGLTRAEMVQAAEMLEKAGIDAVELSGGTGDSGELVPVRKGKIESEAQEVYYRAAAREYKERINVPLLLVGGIRSYPVAGQLVSGNLADYISLCRPFIREPQLVNRWRSGDTAKAACISCNLCFRPAFTGKGIYCLAEKKA